MRLHTTTLVVSRDSGMSSAAAAAVPSLDDIVALADAFFASGEQVRVVCSARGARPRQSYITALTHMCPVFAYPRQVATAAELVTATLFMPQLQDQVKADVRRLQNTLAELLSTVQRMVGKASLKHDQYA